MTRSKKLTLNSTTNSTAPDAGFIATAQFQSVTNQGYTLPTLSTGRSVTTVSWLFVVLLPAFITGCWNQPDADVVLYCAHDAAYAEAVITRFEQQTGLTVDVRFDEEASKSLGLANLLLAEKSSPRCDVFWNNQTLGTIRLSRLDVLEPYVSPNAKRIPAQFKDADGKWTGFAARLRVFIVNTDKMTATPETVSNALSNQDLSRVAIAQPMFGTTLTHYSVLAADTGLDQLQQWHADLRTRGIREVRGNSMTKDLVAEGICDLGFTDTDDAFLALDAGKPVSILPVRMDNGQTIVMPNSVALIRGCRHPEAGKKLIDFLLSAEIEQLLASGPARQIPLGPVDETHVPEEVRQLQEWAADGVPLDQAAAVHDDVLKWLTLEYTGQ